MSVPGSRRLLVQFPKSLFDTAIRGDECGCVAARAVQRVVLQQFTVHVQRRKTVPILFIKGRSKAESSYVTMPPKLQQVVKDFDAGRDCREHHDTEFELVLSEEFLPAQHTQQKQREQTYEVKAEEWRGEQEIRDIEGGQY